MKKNLKIVVIGGGSSYTPELIEGIIKRYNDLPVSTLVLVDIKKGEEKLQIIHALAKRMIHKAQVSIDVKTTLDRKEALSNADFVITQFRVGQIEARILDETIPAKYGLLGQETVGLGGHFKAMRTVPIIYEIIEEMKELCPNAWLINFTNPVGIVSEAVFRYSDFDRFIGVCNVPIHMTNHLAKELLVKPRLLVPVFAGLNHLSYVFNIFQGKKDRLPEIMRLFKNQSMNMKNIDALSYTPEFIERLNVYPGPYQKYYYYYFDMLKMFLKKYENGSVRAIEVKKIEEELFTHYRDETLDVKPPMLEKRGGAYYSDVACGIISSLYNDKRDYHVVNTFNDGHITDLPQGCGIEITARITKDGPIPIYIGPLPPTVRGLIQHVKAYEELLSDAIFEGDLNKALQAWQAHPLYMSGKSEEAFKELIEAHKCYLKPYFGGLS